MQNNAFLCNMKFFTLMIRKNTTLKAGRILEAAVVTVCRERTLVYSLSVSVR